MDAAELRGNDTLNRRRDGRERDDGVEQMRKGDRSASEAAPAAEEEDGVMGNREGFIVVVCRRFCYRLFKSNPSRDWSVIGTLAQKGWKAEGGVVGRCRLGGIVCGRVLDVVLTNLTQSRGFRFCVMGEKGWTRERCHQREWWWMNGKAESSTWKSASFDPIGLTVHWVFYTGYTAHVMTFDVGAVLDDVGLQAPEYCFLDEQQVHKKKKKKKTLAGIETVVGFGSLFRLNQISNI
ncbi:Uncharacterized protein At4g14100 [Linum perenne]